MKQETIGPNTEVIPGKEISEYSMQMAASFMPHITQNQYRDNNVRTLANMFESARKEARKGYIKYRSVEAAAPEMYEALKLCIKVIRESGLHSAFVSPANALSASEAALSKANQ